MDGKVKRIAELYKQIMTELGIEETDENRDTPARVAKALWEMTANHNRPVSDLMRQLTKFGAPTTHPIIVRDIPFVSLCAHHHMPFFGKATVRYRPRDVIFGLSKFPRVIEWFAKKPQTQEALTQEIGDFLVKYLDPVEIHVRLHDTTHTCMSCRGVKSSGKMETEFHYDGHLKGILSDIKKGCAVEADEFLKNVTEGIREAINKRGFKAGKIDL